MKQILFSLLLTLCSATLCMAQDMAVSRSYLALEGGLGYGMTRDMGASPITYSHPEIHPLVAYGFHGQQWRFEVGFSGVFAGESARFGVSGMQCYVGNLSLMRRLYSYSRWQVWGGMAVDERFMVRYMSSLGNASYSYSNLTSLMGRVRAECVLGHFVTHLQLGFAPVSLCLRPGFAFLDNFNQDLSSPGGNTFDQYRWYLAGATLLETDLGVAYQLRNGNRVGISYRWRYLTSRKSADPVSAPYPIEQAGHALLVSLQFAL